MMEAETRVAHVVAGLAARFGGPSATVPRTCAALIEHGVGCELLTIAGTGPEPDAVEGVPVRRCRADFASVPLLRHFRFSRALDAALAGYRLIHSHGLWLGPNVAAGRAARRQNVPHVVSPRGMLAPSALRHGAWRKRVFWRVAQARAIGPDTCFHATSESEYRDIRAFGLDQPVAIIPNGVDRAPAREPDARPAIVYLGRLHPMKALDRLIDAWSRVEPDFPAWRLRLIGPDEAGCRARLAARAAAAGLRSVTLEAPVDGAGRQQALGHARLAVLPSHSENFGMSVAESLAAARPVIASTGTPWQGLVGERCGWWVDNDPASLAAAIRAAISLPPEELAAMGERGRAWMERDFGWTGVGARMKELYAWRLGSGPQPDFVRLD